MAAPANRPFVIVWCTGLFTMLAFVAWAKLFPDAKTRAMKDAPGRELRFPLGVLLGTVTTDSLGEAGAYVIREYGVDEGDDAIVTFYDQELKKLGYARVAPTGDGGWGAPIAQYASGIYTFRLFVRKGPVRIGGVTYESQFPRYLSAKLSD
jgi:hypothetical protein